MSLNYTLFGFFSFCSFVIRSSKKPGIARLGNSYSFSIIICRFRSSRGTSCLRVTFVMSKGVDTLKGWLMWVRDVSEKRVLLLGCLRLFKELLRIM